MSEKKENLFSEEVVEENTEETVEETVEEAEAEADADAEVDADVEVEVVELNDDELESPISKSQEPKSKASKIATQLAAMFLMSLVVSVITAFLVVHFTPAIKYNKAMNLVKKGKYEAAYKLLDSIDEEYDKAKYELNKFVVKIPQSESIVQGNQTQEKTSKVTTNKNYYKIEETVKNSMTGQSTTQSQEITFDDKGNKIKEVIYGDGYKQTIERTFDKNGNILTEKATVEGTDKESPVDYSQYNSNATIKNYRYYYVGK